MSAAIVTGGSAGIGRAVALRLLESGYEVISLDAQATDLPVRHVAVDLADPEATRQAAAEITRTHAVTTLIHNAGVIRPALLPEVKLADLNALTLWSFCLWGAAALHPSLRTRFDPVPSRPPTTLTVRQWAPVIGALLVRGSNGDSAKRLSNAARRRRRAIRNAPSTSTAGSRIQR